MRTISPFFDPRKWFVEFLSKDSRVRPKEVVPKDITTRNYKLARSTMSAGGAPVQGMRAQEKSKTKTDRIASIPPSILG